MLHGRRILSCSSEKLPSTLPHPGISHPDPLLCPYHIYYTTHITAVMTATEPLNEITFSGHSAILPLACHRTYQKTKKTYPPHPVTHIPLFYHYHTPPHRHLFQVTRHLTSLAPCGYTASTSCDARTNSIPPNKSSREVEKVDKVPGEKPH